MASEHPFRIPEPSSSLLSAVLAGRGGWDRLVGLYSPVIKGWLRRRRLQEADVEEVHGEVLLNLARYIGSFDRHRPFVPWLFSIVQCRYIDAHRRRQNRPAGLGGSDFLLLLNEQPDPNCDRVDEDFRLDLLRQALQTVQTRVTPAAWAAFRLVVLEGRTPQGTAEELGTSVQSVYMHVFKVKQRIRDLLGVDEQVP